MKYEVQLMSCSGLWYTAVTFASFTAAERYVDSMKGCPLRIVQVAA